MRLEYQLFCDIRETLKKALPRLNATAGALKTLDALLSLARVAQENEYVRPSINADGRYDIVDGRHPVVDNVVAPLSVDRGAYVLIFLRYARKRK